MPVVAPSDLYPALRRFLLESGLQRTLKVFEKETATGEEVPLKGKKAKALVDLELVAACQLWLDARLANGNAAPKAAEVAVEAPAEVAEAPKKASKKAAQTEAEVEPPKSPKKRPVEAPKSPKTQPAEPPKSPKKRPLDAAVAENTEDAEGAPVAKKSKKDKKDEKEAKEKKAGVPFKRIDEEKWTKAIKDDRLKDNTHTAKQKFGGGTGDSWGDKASEDLLKVKGKGFRKEMAKKKRASWRGGGEIDQGVNSVKFEDTDDE